MAEYKIRKGRGRYGVAVTGKASPAVVISDPKVLDNYQSEMKELAKETDKRTAKSKKK